MTFEPSSSIRAKSSLTSRETERIPLSIYLTAASACAGGCFSGSLFSSFERTNKWFMKEFNVSRPTMFYIDLSTYGVASGFCMVAGILADVYGRKLLLVLAHLSYTVGLILTAAAVAPAMLWLGHFFAGAGIGFTSTGAILYIAEFSPQNIRGRLIMMYPLIYFICILMSKNLGAYFKDTPRYLFGVSAAFSLVFMYINSRLPESPRYLLVKGNLEEATNALRYMWGKEDVSRQIQQISRCAQQDDDALQWTLNKKGFKRMFATPHIRLSVFIGTGLFFFQNFSGINAVRHFSNAITKSSVDTRLQTVIIQAPLLGSISHVCLAIWLVEAIGRVRALVISMLMLTVALSIQTYSFWYMSENSIETHREYEPTHPHSFCLEYTACSDCIKQDGCGYCFVQTENSFFNGSCVSASGGHDRLIYSKYGRCARYNGTEDVYVGGDELGYSFEFCPSKIALLLAIGVIILFAGFAVGIGSISYVVVAEISPMWCRSKSIAISFAFRWLFAFVYKFAFRAVERFAMAWGFLFLCTILNLIGAIFCYLGVPETRDMPLEDVEELFKKTTHKHDDSDLSSTLEDETYAIRTIALGETSGVTLVAEKESFVNSKFKSVSVTKHHESAV